MSKKPVPFDEVYPGMVLLDMHDGLFKGDGQLRELPIVEPVRLNSMISIFTSGGDRFISQGLSEKGRKPYRYTNKYLVVMETFVAGASHEEVGIIKAAWSYDDMRFGLVELEVKLKAQQTECDEWQH